MSLKGYTNKNSLERYMLVNIDGSFNSQLMNGQREQKEELINIPAGILLPIQLLQLENMMAMALTNS